MCIRDCLTDKTTSQNRRKELSADKVEGGMSSKFQSSNNELNVSKEGQAENNSGNDLQIHFVELKTQISEMVTKSEETHTALLKTESTLRQLRQKQKP